MLWSKLHTIFKEKEKPFKVKVWLCIIIDTKVLVDTHCFSYSFSVYNGP